jgi:hypothetical protein
VATNIGFDERESIELRDHEPHGLHSIVSRYVRTLVDNTHRLLPSLVLELECPRTRSARILLHALHRLAGGASATG